MTRDEAKADLIEYAAPLLKDDVDVEALIDQIMTSAEDMGRVDEDGEYHGELPARLTKSGEPISF